MEKIVVFVLLHNGLFRCTVTMLNQMQKYKCHVTYSQSQVCYFGKKDVQGSRIPLSRCPGKVKSTSGIVQKKSVLTRRESQHMSVFILEWSLENFEEIKWSYKAFKLTSFPSI